MPSGRLATILDLDMLLGRGLRIYPPWATLDEMRRDIGVAGLSGLAATLGGRWLLRYVARWQVGKLLNGTTDRTYVTSTAFSPTEAGRWLALPSPWARRRWALLLDAAEIERQRRPVFGPRITRGGGIEFVLEQGFPEQAIVSMSPDGTARWEIEVW